LFLQNNKYVGVEALGRNPTNLYPFRIVTGWIMCFDEKPLVEAQGVKLQGLNLFLRE